MTSEGESLDSYRLEPEAIFHGSIQHIYRAALAIYDEGGKVCTESVISRLGGYLFGNINALEACFYVSPRNVPQFYQTIVHYHALRKARSLGNRIAAEMEGATAQDAVEYCQSYSNDAQSLLPGVSCENQLGTACERLEERLKSAERGETITGLKVPLNAWNNTLGGLCASQLYAVASRPGLGKTAWMEQMVGNLLMAEIPCLVFEKDMAPEMLIQRIACRFAKVPQWKLMRGRLNAQEISAIREINDALKKSPLYLYNPTGLDGDKMGAITRREKRINKIEAVFLDHMQVLNTGKDIREGLTRSSLAIRNTTTETGIPHVILAHINRNGAKGRPTAEDIKEFDQLFGDCDAMALLWSDADRTKLKDGEMLPVNMYFAKNRFGPIIEEKLLFDCPLMSFYDATKTLVTEPRDYQQD